jgi:hypothetical protein
VGLGAEPGADGVVPDVLVHVHEVAVVVDHLGLEPALEQVSHALVAIVERLRIEPVQTLHRTREAVDSGLDDRVEVVGHQAVRGHQ